MTAARRIALALPAALCLGCGAGPATPAKGLPDVLLICLDTVRPDDLGLFSREPTAPFLAELAASGVVFEDACSTSSWTAPATASLLTGLYPRGHGVLSGFFAQEHALGASSPEEPAVEFTAIHPEARPLAGILAAAGYETACVATNINIGPDIGFDRGFEHFVSRDGLPAEEALEQVRAWAAARQGERPWFLYLHLNDAHDPYVEQAPWFRDDPGARPLDRARARYRSELAYLDANLRALFELLPVTAETVVAVVSDHGEEFMEHGGRFHRFSLHAELNRALLLLRGPGLHAGRLRGPVSLVDVAPTLLELAGLDPGGASGDGLSLAPLARGELAPEALLGGRSVFAHRLHPRRSERALWSVFDGRWKLIEGPHGAGLYDLTADPGERRDAAAANPDVLARLRAALEQHRAAPARVGETRRIELDEDLHRRLRELGYTE